MHPFSLFSASKAPQKWLCDAICRKKQLFAGSFGSRSHSFCSFTDENVEFTKSVVNVAKVFDVDVEGELGHVGQVAAGFAYNDKSTFTRPEDAALFAEKTGVTSLAVAFGSCHGVYKDLPNLDLERLQEINAATETPLVLHGGSGIPEDQLEKAFTLGINKFNVATEYITLYEKLLFQYYTEKFGKCSPFEKFSYIRKQLIEYVSHKLQLCKLTV